MSNKSGISSNVISKPQGGGAISGMGEKFSPDLFTGTGNFSVPIAVPEGRNGLQPDLTLSYSTGQGNSPYGQGWSLSLPNVTRKTSKGIPVYDDDADTFILSGAEDLVPVKKADKTDGDGNVTGLITTYRPRTEGLFARIEHYNMKDGKDYWKVWSKDGMISYYGNPEVAGDANTIIADPEHRENIFAWYLYKTEDPFGNHILYEYERDLVDASPYLYDQLYIKTIKYIDYGSTPDYLASVQFNYEDRPDPFSTFNAGFEQRTTKRCTSIQTFTHPEDADLPDHYASGAGDAGILFKTHHLIYLDQRVANGELPQDRLPYNNASLLHRVQVEGQKETDNGTETEQMPPLEFTYSEFRPKERDFTPVQGFDLPSVSLDDPSLELADLFGNGLPDLLQMNGGYIRYWRNLGEGKFDIPREMDEGPSGLELADPDVQMMDADGDGRIDLMVNKPGLAGYFPLNPDGRWSRESFQPYDYVPSFSFADPEVQLMDVDGNGITDVLRNGSRFEYYFQSNPYQEEGAAEADADILTKSRTVGWTHTKQVNKESIDQFPNVSFSNPRIRMADMTGDGLQDIVHIHNGHVTYWPNKGNGYWGARRHMHNSPRFGSQFNPARLLLGDVDGSGLTDLIYVEDNRVILHLNQSGNGWSEAVTISGTPSVTDQDAVRLVDLKGHGVAGILWSYDYGTAANSLYFLDLTGGQKPYLLNVMDNHMGAITRVQYNPSTHFYLHDHGYLQERSANLPSFGRQTAGNPDRVPWQTSLPFPTQCVARVEEIDALSEGKLTTEYFYHHGYWDGKEREFRGFGRVDQRDTEVFGDYNQNGLHGSQHFESVKQKHYSPPTETRNWFHLGPVDANRLKDLDRVAGQAPGTIDWVEPDFSHEYWQTDENMLERPQSMKDELAELPRRARRDAYRTLRGSTLRTELYARDDSNEEDRPYTVTESLSGVREEWDPHDASDAVKTAVSQQAASRSGTGYIFFPHELAKRTTQWERGHKSESMTQLAFTEDYDSYGQARRQVSIGVPRYFDPLTGNKLPDTPTLTEPQYYLSSFSLKSFIHKDKDNTYIVDRVSEAVNYDATEQVANIGSAFDLIRSIRQGNFSTDDNLIGHTVNYYDKDPYSQFGSGDFEQIGNYGALVRKDVLILTAAKRDNAYGGEPTLLKKSPSWPSDYPTAFQNQFEERSGYEYHNGTNHYKEGYYSIEVRNKYDFQDGQPAKGLKVAMQDAMGNETQISYDAYRLLPVKVEQLDENSNALLTTEAANDYRVLKTSQVTDPNDNRTRYGFTPLGMLKKTAVMGKDGESKGDTLTDPTQYLEYDFFAYMTNGNPAWVKTIQREEHYYDNSNADTIQTVEYSDGFGRLLQTRSQAEDIIYGKTNNGFHNFGDSGLPADQSASNQDAVGQENNTSEPNVIVSGWKVYNNKGEVVEQYEPFFDQGFDYKRPSDSQMGQKTRMFYDPRGQVVKTINPDDTEQRVIFGIPRSLSTPDQYTPTPWESYTYDPNDLGGITHSTESAGYSNHWHTPTSAVVDALGRTVKTTEHKSHDTDPHGSGTIEDVVMIYEYDIRGNLTEVTDAKGRIAFEYKYSLRPTKEDEQGEVIESYQIDSGTSTVIYNANGQPVEQNDAKGSFALHAYDALGRPTHVWAKDLSSEDVTLRQRMEYGESVSSPKSNNLLGKLYHQFDEAGVETVTSYDFKGNPLSKQRKVIADSEILSAFSNADSDWNVPTYRVDWTGKDETSSILDSFVYQTDMEYDALDRVSKMTYPEDVNGNRKVMTPTYNKAGNLQKVDFDGTEYVKEIAYNARGQRLLIAFGNDIMTRYIYDNKTFRLFRQKSEKYSYSQSGNDHTYSPQSGTTIQDYGYEFDLVGNILKLKDRTPNSGINNTTLGTDALDREFDYDPLYRLLKATGRESQTQDSTTLWDNAPKTSTPTPQNVRSYTRKYWYDEMGHMEKLKNEASNNNFTRNFSLVSGTNQVDKVTDSQSPANTLADFTWDDAGNMIESDTTRNYEWDHSNQLRAYYNQTGTNEPSVYAHYLYDAGGNRVKKLVRTQGGDYKTTVYIDDAFEYHYKEKNSSTYEKNYCHIMDDSSRIAMIRYGTAFPDDISNTEVYNLEDHLGSSSVRLDTNGAIIDKEEYYPFGDSSLRTFDKKRYRFTGKEKDSESGLYYFGARYYAAWTCRFISVDPKAKQSDYQSSYAYGDNNPMVMNDPDGNQSKVSGSSGGGSGSGGNGSGNSGGGDSKGESGGSDSSRKGKGGEEGNSEVEDFREKRNQLFDKYENAEVRKSNLQVGPNGEVSGNIKITKENGNTIQIRYENGEFSHRHGYQTGETGLGRDYGPWQEGTPLKGNNPLQKQPTLPADNTIHKPGTKPPKADLIQDTDVPENINQYYSGELGEIKSAPKQGQIKEPGFLKAFELYLQSPSNSIGEGLLKISLRLGYSTINDPYTVFAGETLAGFDVTPQERTDAFVGTATTFLFKGIRYFDDLANSAANAGEEIISWLERIVESKKEIKKAK